MVICAQTRIEIVIKQGRGWVLTFPDCVALVRTRTWHRFAWTYMYNTGTEDPVMPVQAIQPEVFRATNEARGFYWPRLCTQPYEPRRETPGENATSRAYRCYEQLIETFDRRVLRLLPLCASNFLWSCVFNRGNVSAVAADFSPPVFLFYFSLFLISFICFSHERPRRTDVSNGFSGNWRECWNWFFNLFHWFPRRKRK